MGIWTCKATGRYYLYSRANIRTAPMSIPKPLAISMAGSAPGALFSDAMSRVVAMRPPMLPLAIKAP